jgi:CRP-like cAMP-binding protein
LTSLPSEDFGALLPRLEPVFLSVNDCLYRPEDEIRFAYFPENAVLTHLHLLQDGSTTEGAMVGRDGMIGLSALLSSGVASHWVQVLISGNALRIPTSVLKDEFDRRYAVQRMVLFYAGARLEQLSQRAVCAGRHRLQSRFCTWLLMLLDRIGESELALTQEEAARHLGVRRAGVTVVANALKNAGAIRYSRGVINVLNRATLLDSACECYQELD